MEETLEIKRLSGFDIKPHVPNLALLRITVFREYPYLYEDENNLAYEEKYLDTYTKCQDSVLILVFDHDKVVGASTAIPLKNEMEAIKAPFLAAGLDINSIFYCGESVLLPTYRGRQIGRRFFAEREAAAREQGYKTIAFCAVERPEHHPLKPTTWHPLDKFWQNQGYVKHPELKAFISWKEIGAKQETEKPMTFWLKSL